MKPTLNEYFTQSVFNRSRNRRRARRINKKLTTELSETSQADLSQDTSQIDLSHDISQTDTSTVPATPADSALSVDAPLPSTGSSRPLPQMQTNSESTGRRLPKWPTSKAKKLSKSAASK